MFLQFAKTDFTQSFSYNVFIQYYIHQRFSLPTTSGDIVDSVNTIGLSIVYAPIEAQSLGSTQNGPGLRVRVLPGYWLESVGLLLATLFAKTQLEVKCAADVAAEQSDDVAMEIILEIGEPIVHRQEYRNMGIDTATLF